MSVPPTPAVYVYPGTLPFPIPSAPTKQSPPSSPRPSSPSSPQSPPSPTPSSPCSPVPLSLSSLSPRSAAMGSQPPFQASQAPPAPTPSTPTQVIFLPHPSPTFNHPTPSLHCGGVHLGGQGGSNGDGGSQITGGTTGCSVVATPSISSTSSLFTPCPSSPTAMGKTLGSSCQSSSPSSSNLSSANLNSNSPNCWSQQRRMVDVQASSSDENAEMFTDPILWKKHLRNQGIRPFQCSYPECPKQFTHSDTLKRHLRTHTGEKPFKCNVSECRRAFADVSNLRRHEMSHTGFKPFKCSVCRFDRRFTRSSTLKRHIIAVHKLKPESAEIVEALRNCRQAPTPRT